MKSNHSDKIIKHLSLKYNVPERVVRMIVMTQFEFVRDSIKSATRGEFETFPSIRLKNFGIWKVQRRKLERITARRKIKEERIKQQEEYESIHNKE